MKCSDPLKNRLKRTHGQMKGVIKMMDDEVTCGNLLVQLKAIRNSIDKTISLLTTENLIQTIGKELDLDREEVHDAIDLIIKGK